jgi:predicted RNA-binding Zn-ribbon protein involved in translation (DUF1610 family)
VGKWLLAGGFWVLAFGGWLWLLAGDLITMNCGMVDTTCPECRVEMDQIEKTTFTGRDMREYQCPKCGRKEILDCGKALWQILSEANEENQEE